MEYREFLDNKHVRVSDSGFEPTAINGNAFPFQRDIIQWACRRGRAELWEDCGLGKSLQELEWARQVSEQSHGRVLMLTPLAVGPQMLREVAKFQIQADVAIVKEQADCKAQICISNYERLHLFDPSKFTGMVADESGILKSFVGKTKQLLCSMFAPTRYKLGGSATPAPNDRKEIGNHSEFLGVMPSNEMLARWFVADSMKSGGYVLRPFAAADFWRWCASWAVAISRPSDLGYPDEGYDLPPLTIVEHVVETSQAPEGFLFDPGVKVSATNVHREKRLCLKDRAKVVADLVNADDDYWAVWCDTDYEADALKRLIPSAIEVRGSHNDKTKEERLTAFGSGEARVIITKPEIGGWGLNWQHCCNTTWFAGYSYEKWYQSVRRLWRFGQKRPVTCHVVMSANEESIKAVVSKKQRQHAELQSEMSRLMRAGMLEEIHGNRALKRVDAKHNTEKPDWLRKRTEAMSCR